MDQIKYIKDFPPPTGYKYDEDLWYQQHGDASVIIDCHASQIYYPEHWTPFSMKCAFKSKEFYKLKNTIYAVGDDHFLLMNEGSRYESYIASDTLTESFTLNFSRGNLDVLATVFNQTRQHLLDDPFRVKHYNIAFIEKLYSYNPAMEMILQKIKILVSDENPDSKPIMELLYLLLEQLLRLNQLTRKEIDNIQANKSSTREELYKRLSIAKDYLHSCYDREINLQQLGQTCYMNSFHLLREFKKHFHTTPHQYLTRIRMTEAQKLIRNSDKTISAIANEVGFEDLSSFSKLFKHHFGKSPLRYREEQ